ncbi:MAG TPA: COX15/CtaA family protein [Euzebya sp.]|nr:COX15/CtaA family protein [Euzebya sp.]
MPSPTDPPTPAFRRLALAAAVTALVVIAVGGATRATDSGLACPTWPGCFTGGDFLPPISGQFVDGLGRTVTGMNIWLEHSHRLVAGVLALQIAVLLVWVLRSHRHVPGLLWPVVVAAVAVNVQALLGALVVWNLVRVELVTTHLGLGTATMALMVYLAARARGVLRAPADPGRRRLWRFAVAVTAVLWLQILVGGHLTGIHGGLAFKSDAMLGLFSVGPIAVEAEAVNVAHRYLGYLVAGLIMAVGIGLKRHAPGGPAVSRALRWTRIAAVLTGLQILLGVANLYSDLSFVSVIPHLMVASWILVAMVMVCVALATEPSPAVDHLVEHAEPALEPVR